MRIEKIAYCIWYLKITSIVGVLASPQREDKVED